MFWTQYRTAIGFQTAEQALSEMSKYGLNLRAKKTQQPTRPPLPTPSGFGGDDDDDVEREISRHASKNKSLKEVVTQHLF